jgi:DNA-3-methyladenine glycosylase I
MKKYKEIFDHILETIIQNSAYPRETVHGRFERFKHFDFESFDDYYLYQVLAYIPFYAGMKSKTVTNKIDAIKGYFSDYKAVARYTSSDINKIMTDPKMIRHPVKIGAAIINAKKVEDIVQRHGSFKAYLESLHFNRSQKDLENAATTLMQKFSYLGPATVHHFLMEIGAKTIKPDRVIMRVFSRLKLIGDVSQTDEARRVSNLFVEATGDSHRYVDIVIVKLGHVEDDLDLGLPQGICLENGPRCNQCLVIKHCFYKH